MRTFKRNQRHNNNPWAAPGTAQVFSPCGVSGGNPYGCPVGNKGNYLCQGGGHAFGAHAEEYYANKKVTFTEWERGSIQNTAFSLLANHGGGYQYRLCKVPASGRGSVTEECFQKNPLQFYGSTHRIAWNSNEASWQEIPAMDTNVGTMPAGSTWRRNPIPACDKGHGGFLNNDNSCPQGTQFEAPGKGLHGFSVTHKGIDNVFKWVVVDQVKVPSEIPTGEYVLSWRWDNDQTPQIWNTCAAIKITQPKDPKSDPRSSCKVVYEREIAYQENDLNDGRKLLLKSEEDCSKKCLERADCVGFVWVKNKALGEWAQNCWMKHKLTKRGTDGNCISGKVVCDGDDNGGDDGSDGSDDGGSGDDSYDDGYKKGYKDGYTDGFKKGQEEAKDNGCTFERGDGYAYHGYDLVDGRTNQVSSASVCEAHCEKNDKCKGYTFVHENPHVGEFSKSCWLKYDLRDRRNEEIAVTSGMLTCTEKLERRDDEVVEDPITWELDYFDEYVNFEGFDIIKESDEN